MTVIKGTYATHLLLPYAKRLVLPLAVGNVGCRDTESRFALSEFPVSPPDCDTSMSTKAGGCTVGFAVEAPSTHTDSR